MIIFSSNHVYAFIVLSLLGLITYYKTNIKFILGRIAERLNKRGLIILISDLIDEPENIIKGLKHIRHKNQEIIVFHISDEKELSLDFGTRTTLDRVIIIEVLRVCRS